MCLPIHNEWHAKRTTSGVTREAHIRRQAAPTSTTHDTRQATPPPPGAADSPPPPPGATHDAATHLVPGCTDGSAPPARPHTHTAAIHNRTAEGTPQESRKLNLTLQAWKTLDKNRSLPEGQGLNH